MIIIIAQLIFRQIVPLANNMSQLACVLGVHNDGKNLFIYFLGRDHIWTFWCRDVGSTLRWNHFPV